MGPSPSWRLTTIGYTAEQPDQGVADRPSAPEVDEPIIEVPWWHPWFRLAGVVANGLLLTALIGLTVLFLHLHRQDPAPLTRLQLRLVLPGLVVSCAVACFGLFESTVISGSYNVAELTPLVFYLGVVYAMLRRDRLDLDRFVRRTAVYTAVCVILTGAYAACIFVIHHSSLPPLDESPAWLLEVLLLVAIVFKPLRSWVEGPVDRMFFPGHVGDRESADNVSATLSARFDLDEMLTRAGAAVDAGLAFFRGRVDYRQAVGNVSAALTTLLDLEGILTRVGVALDEGIAPSSLAVVLWMGEASRAWRLADGRATSIAHGDTIAIRDRLVAVGRRPWRVPEAPTSTDVDRAREEAIAFGATWVVPLPLGDRMLGALLLGPKQSGRPYEMRDRELVATIVAQSAIAIANGDLFAEVTALNRELEAKVERRTAELHESNVALRQAYRDLQDAQAQLLHVEKMAALGQLTAGLAHEINTPVTAVLGNVSPLWSEISRLCDHATLHDDSGLEVSIGRLRAIVGVISRGAERTAGIVQDLRVFSRVGEITMLPTDVHEGIDVSLRLLRPRWADRIEVYKDYGAVPPIEASAGQLNQVFVNLLANAFDAIEGPGNVWIVTRADAGQVVVTVRDDGCGIATEHVGRVFDPFFTTKAVGKGMGLGLAISATIVRDHGGSLFVNSVVGKGATFTIMLPMQRSLVASPPHP